MVWFLMIKFIPCVRIMEERKVKNKTNNMKLQNTETPDTKKRKEETKEGKVRKNELGEEER